MKRISYLRETRKDFWKNNLDLFGEKYSKKNYFMNCRLL
jgi:hypothetical protein